MITRPKHMDRANRAKIKKREFNKHVGPKIYDNDKLLWFDKQLKKGIIGHFNCQEIKKRKNTNNRLSAAIQPLSVHTTTSCERKHACAFNWMVDDYIWQLESVIYAFLMVQAPPIYWRLKEHAPIIFLF